MPDQFTPDAAPTVSFTPGPWQVQPVIGTWIETVGDPYGHGRMHIADVRGWGHLTGAGSCRFGEEKAIAIQTANARLIAAAPDLLAVVRALSEFQCTYETNTQSPGWMPGNEFYSNLLMIIVRDARAALAKAEGAA
jgi:hypothetical protein